MKLTLAFLVALLLTSHASTRGADVTLLSEGRSDYQIVLPDTLETPELTECLNQTARLVQTAFIANGVDVGVVTETQRDSAKPALLLGNTRFAQQHGVDVTKLRDWSYVLRVVGKDLIIAGHDHPAKAPAADPRRPNWDRVGTAKAAVDFLREFMGVRFLYPEMQGYTPGRLRAKSLSEQYFCEVVGVPGSEQSFIFDSKLFGFFVF